MSVAQSSKATGVDAEKVAFIEAALANGVLLFGEFTLKSGRSVYPQLDSFKQLIIQTITILLQCRSPLHFLPPPDFFKGIFQNPNIIPNPQIRRHFRSGLQGYLIGCYHLYGFRRTRDRDGILLQPKREEGRESISF